MSTITKSIGTSGRDYSTITAWEADLDNAAVYAAGDDAVGECYNDSAFDESVIINGGGTVGLASATLTAAAGHQHDGTAGTGARIVLTSKVEILVSNPTFTLSPPVNTLLVVAEWLEIYDNHQAAMNSIGVDIASPPSVVRNCLVHGVVSPGISSRVAGVYRSHNLPPGVSGGDRVLNSVIYDVDGGGTTNGDDAFGVYASTSRPCTMSNVTVHNVRAHSNYDPAYGISVPDGSAITLQNAIVTDCINTGSFGAACFSQANFVNALCSHNLSSDTTASGTGSFINKAAENQFVSTLAGSEDLHLKAGSVCIDAGTDLGTTPTGVNIDIDGRDRDAESDVWDIGADEYVAESTRKHPIISGSIIQPVGSSIIVPGWV